MGPCTIVHTATALPAHRLPQESVKRSLCELLPMPEHRKAAVLALFDHALVDTRAQRPAAAPSCASAAAWARPWRSTASTPSRLGREVTERCLREADVPARAIDLVITVSCTGVMIPSLDAHLANALGFRPDVKRLPITELGCVAGAAALGRAHDFLRGHPEGHVLVVAVELPTLSFQHDDVSIAPAGLDGAVRRRRRGRPADRPAPAARVSILETESHLFPDTLDALGFELRDDGFHVVLAKDLPERLRGGLARVVDGLLGRARVCRARARELPAPPGRPAHPRGPRGGAGHRPAPRCNRPGTCCATTATSRARPSCSCSTAGCARHRPPAGASGPAGRLRARASPPSCRVLRWN